MNFFKAMEALEQGKKSRDKHWDTDGYIYLDLEDGLVYDEEDCEVLIELNPQLLKDEFEIYEEPERFLFFNEVLPLLREGRKFKRKEWARQHIFAHPLTDMICFKYEHIDVTQRWTPKVSDLLDSSWLEVK